MWWTALLGYDRQIAAVKLRSIGCHPLAMHLRRTALAALAVATTVVAFAPPRAPRPAPRIVTARHVDLTTIAEVVAGVLRGLVERPDPPATAHPVIAVWLQGVVGHDLASSRSALLVAWRRAVSSSQNFANSARHSAS